MKNIIDLSDKNIVITGASSGIGRQVAITLSEVGAKIILLARREDKLKETLDSLQGDNHIYYSVDLSKTEDIGKHIENIVSEHGKIDGLVYAAGVNDGIPLNKLTPERIESVFKINFFGFTEIVRQVCKKSSYNQGLSIVGISSVAGYRGTSAHEAYSASKAAMDGFVRCVAREKAKNGIRINTVAPSMISTDMYKRFLEVNGIDSEANIKLLEKQYLGIGETEDVSNMIAYLLSPAARFITGTCVHVDGGYLS